MLQILWFKKCYLAVNATEENEQEEIEMSLISKLYDFVENKGRFEKGREPVYGEPFYHDYVYQLIKSKYEIGDRLRVESEDGTIEGIMISFCNYEITLLTSGNKVWKRKNAGCHSANTKYVRMYRIKSVELIEKKKPDFDLDVVDEYKYYHDRNTPNIIGEIGNATQTLYFIQPITTGKALFSIGTHHARTTRELVRSLANNLLELEVCKTQKEAVEMVADAVNIDCHLIEVNGNRYIERITEIIPNKDKGAEPFAEKDILRCDAQNVFVTGFSDEMKSKIVSKLTKAEKEEFLHDIGMCDLISQGKISPEVNMWMEAVLAY